MATKQSLYVRVQEQLITLIQERNLQPHDPLPSEGELAELLQVSRSSLREATRSLQSSGVLYAHAGKGLFLQEFSLAPVVDRLPYHLMHAGVELAEILEVRAALERGLITQVAMVVTEDDLRELDALVDAMYEVEAKGEPFPELDKRFHFRLYERLGNSLLDELLAVFWSLRERMEAELPPAFSQHLAALHRHIVDSLRSGSIIDPVAAMNQHFVDITQRVINMTHEETMSHRNRHNQEADNA